MIKKICTKLTALMLVINLVLIGPAGFALAQEASPDPGVTSENTDTGSSSDNIASATTDQTSDTTNTNNATVNNETTGDVTSGSNTTSDNTGDGTIDASNSTINATTNTTVNQVVWEPMPWTTWTGEGDWTSQNQNTGSSSTNTATTTGSQTNNLTNTNTADINNNSDIGSSTGSNSASDNTGDASITTGDVSTTSSTQNVANLNIGYWTGDGDWTNLWNGEALNYLTGSSSDNESTIEFTKLLTVLNENGVDISNILASNASSGANTASDNTGNATINTGSASLLAALFNMANTNIFGTGAVDILYQDVYGNYSGNIDLSSASPYSLVNLAQASLTLSSENQITGFNSDNTAGVNGSLTFDITNTNEGNLLNDLGLEAITGNNTASDNTGDAQIETGNASIIANLINMLNTNIFTNEFYFGVINVYGNWLGNLILPEYPTSGYVAGGVDGSAGNSFTGSGSTNTADVTLDKNLDNTNNNTGTVENNFNLTAATGDNSASDNTMNGSVETGSATGEANVANWVNTNVVSDAPWWLVLVNNLGTWIPILQNPVDGTQIVLDLDDLGLGGSGGATSASATNDHTGTISDNNASVDLSLDGSVTNNNTGNIINNLDALALTGGNNADRNTGSGSVTTGNASLWINALNFLNTNITAPSFMLAIVNVFGSWTGDVLDHGDDAPILSQVSGSQGGGQGGCGSCNSSNTSPTTSSNSSGGSNSSQPEVSSSQGGSGGEAVVKNVISFVSGGDTPQVLSFFEENDSPGQVQSVSSVAGNQNLIKYYLYGIITMAILLLAFKLRKHIKLLI